MPTSSDTKKKIAEEIIRLRISQMIVNEEYKAKRVKAEPELISQLERAPKVFEAFGIPMYEAPGFEADDGVGSIVAALSPRLCRRRWGRKL